MNTLSSGDDDGTTVRAWSHYNVMVISTVNGISKQHCEVQTVCSCCWNNILKGFALLTELNGFPVPVQSCICTLNAVINATIFPHSLQFSTGHFPFPIFSCCDVKVSLHSVLFFTSRFKNFTLHHGKLSRKATALIAH